MANAISTIDLWLPHESNRAITYDKVFRAGFDRKGERTNEAITASYDFYRVVKNCYCDFDCSEFELPPRRTAIIFYREGKPIRLLVDSIPEKEVEKYINHALVQRVGSARYNSSLTAIYDRLGIASSTIDMAKCIPTARAIVHSIWHQKVKMAASKRSNPKQSHRRSQKPFLSSCDRWDLFLQFIDNSKHDPALNQSYTFDPKFRLSCFLETKDEVFNINHQGAFVSADRTQYIMIQRNSSIMP